jgi:hypothetical protein
VEVEVEVQKRHLLTVGVCLVLTDGDCVLYILWFASIQHLINFNRHDTRHNYNMSPSTLSRKVPASSGEYTPSPAGERKGKLRF